MPSIHRNDYEPDSLVEIDDAQSDPDALEPTDIDSDEHRDGDVDAEGGSAIESRDR